MLPYANLFLGLVDLFGIWRRFGGHASIGDAPRAEEQPSHERTGAPLFSTNKFDGLSVRPADGTIAADAPDALVRFGSGTVGYLVVRAGGVGETVRQLLGA